MEPTRHALRRAADLVGSAEALIIGAGAGMSADSGVPVYRGSDGLYTDPEGLREASAALFETDPISGAEAVRRRHLSLLAAQPHRGYEVLDGWRRRAQHGAVVYTSNVDGMFVRAGFPEESVYEVHGSLARSQCLNGCGGRGAPVFATPDPAISAAICPHCLRTARPNTLMFGDYDFNDSHRATQWEALGSWFDKLPDLATVVVLEVGAGDDVRTVRVKCETLAAAHGWPLIRINPSPDSRPSNGDEDRVSVRLPALEALLRIDTHITDSRQ